MHGRVGEAVLSGGQRFQGRRGNIVIVSGGVRIDAAEAAAAQPFLRGFAGETDDVGAVEGGVGQTRVVVGRRRRLMELVRQESAG